jgi:hypothetical protein
MRRALRETPLSPGASLGSPSASIGSATCLPGLVVCDYLARLIVDGLSAWSCVPPVAPTTPKIIRRERRFIAIELTDTSLTQFSVCATIEA